LRHCATSRTSRVWFPMWSLRSNRSCRPGVDSSCSRNEYQESSLGVKTAAASAWQPFHHHVPAVWQSWSRDSLSRPVQGELYLYSDPWN
jgi:hypothetical protein